MLAHQVIQYYSRSFPSSPMITDDQQQINFAEGFKQINRISNLLIEQGLARGDRVAIIGENSPQHLLLLFAVAQAGMVMVPLNFRLAIPEISYITKDAGAKLILATDVESADKALAVSKETSKNIPVYHHYTDAPKAQCWQNALDAATNKTLPFDTGAYLQTDTILQLYTSGTTGHPKGVLLSHKNICTLAFNASCGVLTKAGYGTRDLIIAPLFHVGGLCTATNAILGGGGVVLHRRFDPIAVANALEHDKITNVFMVPAMIQALVHGVTDIKQRSFSKLKRITYGAAPITVPLLEEVIDIFNCEFVQYFGMTETCGGVLSLSWPDHQRALAGEPDLLKSCGRTLPNTDLKIVDDNHSEVPCGQTGEIAMRSTTNMNGYWNLEETTNETLIDGWVYSGDAGYADKEGFVYLRDRIKDMVVTGGENVYPVEVENVLSAHPSILEIAVIGVPNEQYGEALLAIVVLKKSTTLELNELIAFAKEKIAGYKIPRQIKIVEALPRNPSGKVLKNILRKPYWQDQERNIG